MKPILFDINGFEVRALPVFLVLAFIVFLFLSYRNLRGHMSAYRIFDIAFLSSILSLLLSRAIYFFDNLDQYNEIGWYLLPIAEEANGISFFSRLPWNFFAFLDGGFVYYTIPIGLVYAVAILVRNSRHKVNIRVIYMQVWRAFIPALFLIIFGFLLDGTYMGKITSSVFGVRYDGHPDLRFGVQVIELVFLLLLFFIYLDPLEKAIKGLGRYLYLLFPLMWWVIQIALSFQIEGHQSLLLGFGAVQMLYFFMMIIYVLLTSVQREDATSDTSQRVERVKFARSFMRENGEK